MKPKLVILVGPTAVGKSAAALELASEFDCEIVNADSQLVYRRLDIGTAKPPARERKRIRHHLIDVVDPDQEFNAAMFRELALAAVRDIQRRGRNALICGGTGLYVKALTHGLFQGPAADFEYRAALAAAIETGGLEPLYRRLLKLDPEAARRIHPNDRQRIVRALEVCHTSGRPMSLWQEEHRFGEANFATLKIGLERQRRDLYERIDARCRQMVADGLLDELRALAGSGYSLDLKTLLSVGYRHMGLVLKGAMELEAALALMQRDTRRLAKRQLTWFRGDGEIAWFDADHLGAVRARIAAFLGRA